MFCLRFHARGLINEPELSQQQAGELRLVHSLLSQEGNKINPGARVGGDGAIIPPTQRHRAAGACEDVRSQNIPCGPE